MSLKKILFSASIVALCLVMCQRSQAALISASTTTPNIMVGDFVTVDLDISGWNTSEQVDAIQFDVKFDQTVTSYDSGTVLTAGANTFMTLAGGSPGDVSNDVGVGTGTWIFGVSDSALDLVGSGPTFTNHQTDLGSVKFKAEMVGTSTITLSNAIFLDEFGGSFTPTGGTPSGLNFQGVTITVPEPSAAVLLSGWIVGVAFAGNLLRRRRGTQNTNA